LVNGGKAAENDMIADVAMPGEGRMVHQRNVVPDLAIVRDMRADK
jgi:hypothetical protein